MALILFPHSYIDETLIEKTLRIFDSLTLSLPWEMDAQEFIRSQKKIELLHPHEELKPTEKIQSLLSQYHNWIGQNLDTSYLEGIRSQNLFKSTTSDSSSWEIRSVLNNMISETTDSPDNNSSIAWHMILHMARTIEEQRIEAEKLLKSLKAKHPLFDENHITDTNTGFFDDLPGFVKETGFSEKQITNILNAWFGLFISQLKGSDLLLTHSRQVSDILLEKYSIIDKGVIKKKIQTIHIDLPISPANNGDTQDTILWNPGDLAIKELILSVAEDPEQKFKELSRLSSESNSSINSSNTMENISMTLTHFHRLQDNDQVDEENSLDGIEGRTLLLINV